MRIKSFIASASFCLACLFESSVLAATVQKVVAGVTITTPPNPLPSECPTENLFKRAPASCSFGSCGTTCLEQGAFCCSPGGTLAVEPVWICDNGACITSVRGDIGIVDCYDPDNPSGTTQSCIDNVPTTTCHSTDRCYTCETDVPFCHWQTYVQAGNTSLGWFSCISTKTVDETFYATSVTNHLLPAAPTDIIKVPILSTGAIAGIAAGGGVLLLACIIIVVWFCMKKSKAKREQAAVVQPPPQMYDAPNYYSHELSSHGRLDDPDYMTPYSPSSGISQPHTSYHNQHETWKHGHIPMEAGSTPVAELPGEVSTGRMQHPLGYDMHVD